MALAEDNTATDYYSVRVKYYPGRTVLGAQPAILRLKEGVVSLTTQDNKKPFSVPVSQIKKVGTSASVLFITTSEKTFKIEFGYLAGAMIGSGTSQKRKGVNKLSAVGFYWWQDYFKSQGIPVAPAPIIKYILAGLSVLGVLLVLLFIFTA